MPRAAVGGEIMITIRRGDTVTTDNGRKAYVFEVCPTSVWVEYHDTHGKSPRFYREIEAVEPLTDYDWRADHNVYPRETVR